ncbi:uncharacterized protein LOC133199677 [Saccostrea echinata]|uniref:uncharacterized protein LOC133199677 n=1 Tax=Saccostrea echinata TaxID=191078 RepID=UPI002A82EB10|nr:uncharacterized protein LOC133199677 [Saccostrea echinata]
MHVCYQNLKLIFGIVDGERASLIRRIKKTKVTPGIKQITCREGLTWLGNGNELLVSIDKDGKQKDTVCLGEGEIKYHTFTEEGDLLFIYRNSLMRFVKRQLRPFIMYFSDGFVATCVACSVHTGDVFTGLQNKDKQCSKVARFSKIGKELQVYERDSKVGVLFKSPVHLATMKNEDICICDSEKGVVIIDITGNHLFTYPINNPTGLTVDKGDNILVCDGSETIHVITAEGQLRRKLCVGRKGVAAVGVDMHSALLIGYQTSSIVEVYRY